MLFTCIVCKLFSPRTVKQLNAVTAVASSYFENVLSLIRTLLQAGMDVNFITALGDTALSIAANEASKCIAFCRQMNMSTARHERERAAEVGEFLRATIFTVVRELLGHNADWQIGRSNGIDLLNVALHSNQTDLLVELVCQGAEPKSWPEYLILVFESETQSVVEKTLETLSSIGVTVDIRNDARQTALHIAAERDLPGVVRDLIYIGADTEAVDVAGRTPLQSAVGSDSSNAIVAFQSRLPAGLISTSNAVGRSALHIAVEEDCLDEVVRLLERGVDVEVLDDDGRSPLVTALVCKRWNSARAILDHREGAVASSQMDVVVDSEGTTVLHLLSAVQYGDSHRLTPVDVFRRVLDGGVAVNARNFNGNTPLHGMRQDARLSQLLIDHGADVNAQNGRGQTPLHVAFRAGDMELVRCLIHGGADLNVRDDFNNTPFHCDTSFHSEWKLLIPDLPQSVVRSDALNVFGAPPVFQLMTLDDSQPRRAQINTSYCDCLGNTALHVAAGVTAPNSAHFTSSTLTTINKNISSH